MCWYKEIGKERNAVDASKFPVFVDKPLLFMKGTNALILLLLLALIRTDARKPKTLLTVRIHNRIGAISRGGAGPWNAKDTAKVTGQESIGASAPANTNAVDGFLIFRSVTVFLSIAHLVWMLVWKGSEVMHAVCLSSIRRFVETLHPLLNESITKHGLCKRQQYLLVVFWMLVLFTTCTGSRSADLFVKASAIMDVGIGLTIHFLPQESLKFFFDPAPNMNTVTKVLMETLATCLLAHGIIVSSLMWGDKNVGAVKAVGYGFIAMALLFISLTFASTKDWSSPGYIE